MSARLGIIVAWLCHSSAACLEAARRTQAFATVAMIRQEHHLRGTPSRSTTQWHLNNTLALILLGLLVGTGLTISLCFAFSSFFDTAELRRQHGLATSWGRVPLPCAVPVREERAPEANVGPFAQRRGGG
mmetsp:Transcript_41070/g.89739  ORF Transcript_41070/g.89739 Transcript_41070/m.89739 type:complete len:130 (+) Transcript_41070:79-468(+)